MELGDADLTQHLLHNTTNAPRVLQGKPRSLVGNPGSSHGEGVEVTPAAIAARRAQQQQQGQEGTDDGSTGLGVGKGPGNVQKRRKSLACIE